MAYPFVQFPTLQEFVDTLMEKHGAELKTVTASPPEEYLVRSVNGVKCVGPLPRIARHERLSPTNLRSLCVQLDINPAEFGYSLGLN